MWFFEKKTYVAFYTLLFCVVIFYLLVIGPWIITKTNRGNRLIYYGRYSLLYCVMSFPSLVYVTLTVIGIPRLYCISIRGKLHQVAGKVMGISWETRRPHGNSSEDTESEAVIVINHQLWADFFGVWGINPPLHRLQFVMKKENIILFPYILEFLRENVLIIDRSNGPVAYRMLESAVVETSKTKKQIVVFPEGTRNWDCIRWSVEGGRRIKDFKSGAFRAAIKAGVSILPIVMSPYYFIDEERRIFGQGKIIMKILPKISTEGMKFEDAKDLLERTHVVMSDAYEELKKEIIGGLPKTHYLRG